ncbi:asparagine synthase (glutamine-hydrolyzing) [Magnetococcales bacterium HHB-1]
MCGIIGWSQPQSGISPERLKKSLETLRHRGPDQRATFFWHHPEHPEAHHQPWLGLGHARLSIIDPTPASHQPMHSDDGRYTLVFNGEIYNYKELREKLQQGGIHFKSQGDSEVLLQWLIRYGEEGIRQLNGMWSLALWDKKQRKILLSRDRHGKKPLFFQYDKQPTPRFIFASEPKAIFAITQEKRQLNLEFLMGYFVGKRWPFFDHGGWLYNNITLLRPGTLLTYDLDQHRIHQQSHNLLSDYIPTEIIDHHQADQLLDDAVHLRLRSDVPIGVMVSGGIDSSITAAIAAKYHHQGQDMAFYTLKDKKEDLPYARRVAKALDIPLKEIPSNLPGEEVFQIIQKMVHQFELPLNYRLAAYPCYIISQAMANDNIRVILDGTGGDEIFCGYHTYLLRLYSRFQERGERKKAWQLKPTIDQILGLQGRAYLWGWIKHMIRFMMPNNRWTQDQRIPSMIASLDQFGPYDRQKLLKIITNEYAIHTNAFDNLTDIQKFEISKGPLQAYHLINDQASMSHSVELRSPFLDYRLIQYLRLPEQDKFRHGYMKYRLRKLAPESIDDIVRWRRQKAGFDLNQDDFFKKNQAAVLKKIQDSPLLNQIFQLKSLIKHEQKTHRHPLPIKLQLFYTFTLLEAHYDLTL